MIKNQLKTRGITDLAVLNAMAEVPRHKFVPGSLKSSAYEDRPLPIGYQQTISQPYIVAYMTEILQPAAEHSVLEVGTGSGYQAAILSKLVKEVHSIEIVKELAESARQRLRTLGYNNVFVKTGNGYAGWTEHAPYDRIIITAAPPEIPEALIDQLASGGLLVGPVGVANQRIVIITRTGTGLSEKHTLPVRFVPMVGGSQN
jgi:protein-L-isoaspartate(D-aspartate) O-methyltransferase